MSLVLRTDYMACTHRVRAVGRFRRKLANRVLDRRPTLLFRYHIVPCRM